MRNLLTIALVSVLLLSCTRDNDGLDQSSETVSLNLELDLNLSLEKSDEANKAVGLTNKFSEFEHIFKDEVDLVFTSTTTTFSTTLTITPNDLSNTPTLVIPYGTYSWSISDEEEDYNADLFMRSYLPIFGSGQVEIYSSEVSINLTVDTYFGLVTVEKENVSSAKLSLEGWEKNLVERGGYFYLYAVSSDGYQLFVEENVYNTTITTYVNESSMIYAKTHYNYILAFSDVDVNSITIKSAPFTQYDFYLQPTSTVSSTCTLSLSPYQSQHLLTQTVSATSTIQNVTFSTSTTCSETINYSVSGLPEGVSMDIIELTFPRITGTVSSSVSSGTYNYTITAFNSTSSATATVSATATGTIIVTNANINSQSGYNYNTVQIGEQIWFSENLKEIKYQNGDPIVNIEDNDDWTNTSQAAFSYFDNNPNNVVLYNWAAVTSSKNICPQGYRVPTKEDYETLFSFIKGDGTNADRYNSLISGGDSGFNASNHYYRPAGGSNSVFTDASEDGYTFFWTSSSRVTSNGRSEVFVWLYPPESTTLNNYTLRAENWGFCVRCIKN